MAYQAIARTYRPQTFEEVVGQDHVSRTLMNAIEGDKIAHAYLFSGPRGVGKTTTARVLAKALNCKEGPSTTPCNKCSSCLEITEGSSLDIMEIDGASNRGIDEIRTLRENVKFMPASSKYKVYIIDEVHQITKEAFNALLKTLEEPPAHVIFMMATTEPERIPATILSRCQKFSFKLITHTKIFDHLKGICKKEKVKVNDEALNLVASCGQGSVRDAMSILDQVISFAGKKEIGKEDVVYILGIIPEEILLEFSDCVIENRVKDTLSLVDKVIEQGYDIHQFLSDLRGHFRNMLVIKAVGKDRELLPMSEDSMDLLLEKAGQLKEDNIIRIINTLGILHERMKWSEQPRIVFEVGIFELCRKYVSIDDIIAKLAVLEGNATGGDDDYNTGGGSSADKPAGRPQSKAAPREFVVKAPVRPAVPEKEIVKETVKEEAPPAEVPPEESLVSEKPEVKADPAEEEVVSSSTTEFDDDRWQNMLNDMDEKNQLLYHNFVKGIPERVENNTLFVAFHKSNKFYKGSVERKKEELKEFVRKFYGENFMISLILSDSVPLAGSGVPLPKEEEEEDEPITEELYKDIKETDPVAGNVIDIFDGKIVKRKKIKD